MELLTAKDLADLMGWSLHTVYQRRYRADSLPKSITVGQAIRLRREDVEQWLRSTPTRRPPLPMASGVLTRSAKGLADRLDPDAVSQIDAMTEAGWEPSSAATAWVDYIHVLAESAANGAIAEMAWESSSVANRCSTVSSSLPAGETINGYYGASCPVPGHKHERPQPVPHRPRRRLPDPSQLLEPGPHLAGRVHGSRLQPERLEAQRVRPRRPPRLPTTTSTRTGSCSSQVVR